MPVPVKKPFRPPLKNSLPRRQPEPTVQKNPIAEDAQGENEILMSQDDDLFISGYDSPRQPNIPEGTFPAKVENIKKAEPIMSKKGNSIPMLEITFNINNYRVIHKIPSIMRDGYPLVLMLEGGFGYTGEGINLKSLVGKQCIVRITHYRAANGNVWENIAEVLPMDVAETEDEGEGNSLYQNS